MKDHYTLDTHEYGQGAFGSVTLGIHNKSGELRAIKSLNLENMDASERKDHIMEVEILCKLDHPHIVKVYEYFESSKCLYIVMEYLQGQTLLDYLYQNKKVINEELIIDIMFQLLSAVCYLTSKGIVHRDIKSENMIYNGDILTLIDFGNSKECKTALLKSTVGTVIYMSPEVLNGSYNSKCDVWACGILLYILLSGHMPYSCNRNEELFECIRNEKFKVPFDLIPNTSSEARSLLTKLLNKDPSERFSAKEAITHPFFASRNNKLTKELVFSVYGWIKHYMFENKLQEAIFKYYLHNVLDKKSKLDIVAVFHALD